MRKYLTSALLAILFIFAGCQSDFGIKQAGIESWIIDHQATALSGSGLSVETKDYLLRTGNFDNYKSNPEKMLKKLHREVMQTHDRKLVAVLVELCYYQAEIVSDEDRSAFYYLSSAVYAYAYLFDPLLKSPPSPYEPEFIYAVRFYNFATARIFRYLKNRKLLSTGNFTIPFLTGTVKFNKAEDYLPYKIDHFTKFLICYEYLPIGFHNHTRQSGLGVPLVAVADEFKRKKQGEIFNISEIACPASFFMRFKSTDRKNVEAFPEYHDPFITDSLDINKNRVPLEIDLSTYLGFILKDGAKVSPILAMMNPTRMVKTEGLYMLTPYDKNKVPVVLIHGLMSNARTWVQMLNTLLKYPVIREKYQFWFFAYPTANPVIYSAAQLRNALKEARRKFDPEGNAPSFNRMVLIGHSMGGLLTKMMVQTPGNVFLKEGLNLSSLDKLNLTEKQKKYVEEMIMFKRLPFVNEVIFINVPHRGSETTHYTIAVLAAKLINMPKKLIDDFTNIQRKVLIASGIKKNNSPIYICTGVDNLDPDNKAIKIIAGYPIVKGVTYHSIIGNNEEAGIPGGTDGIVSYKSAHLEGAASELVILSDHSGQKKPAAIMEVRRILLNHLEKTPAENTGKNDKSN